MKSLKSAVSAIHALSSNTILAKSSVWYVGGRWLAFHLSDRHFHSRFHLRLRGGLRGGGEPRAGVLEGVGPTDLRRDALELVLVLEELANLLVVARGLVQLADDVKPLLPSPGLLLCVIE
jgi:hypothetical protein